MSGISGLLRLELERPPDAGELVNLIQNTNGRTGAWFWVTPMAGSVMRGGVNVVPYRHYRLEYTSPGGAASYFYTVPMPVTAGTYVAAHWSAWYVDGLYSAQVEWLDVSKAVVGSTAATANLPSSEVARAAGSFLVPVGALYCRLRFDHYNASGGNPAAGDRLELHDVTLTDAPTAGDLAVTRTNLMPTPTAENGRGGWRAQGGAEIGTTTAQAWVGTKSFAITKDDTAGPADAVSPSMTVTPGRDYALQARSRSRSDERKVTVSARWLKADGSVLTTVPVKSQTEANGIWTVPIGGVATAPTNAASLRLIVHYPNLDAHEVHMFDAVMVEQASAVSTYFDGATPGALGYTFEWAGTAYASSSIASGPTGDPGVLVPVAYQNILGPTGRIAVDREDLNVGSLSVQLYDAILDPTQTDLVRPGKRIRLLSVDPDSEDPAGEPEVLFEGKTFTASVQYNLLEANEQKRAEVNLSAVDPINPLASTPSREGVATIAELPHVLEGAGAPWNVNGSGDQVASPVVVAYNDNASALDQVAVTRDSALGYAWVDRNGVLQAWDAALLDTTVAADLDETTYNADIDVDFDLERIINSVTVKALRVIATSGVTEEVTFGPYVDLASYQQWGEHHQEFTVQGFDTANAAAIQAYAEQILAANATPHQRVNSLVLPILTAADLPKARLDLYDLVHVVNGRANVDENSRVVSIHHEITATNTGGKWLTTLGFARDGSVASPFAVPSPPPGVGPVKEELEGSIQGALDEAAASFNFAKTLNAAYRQPTAPTNPDAEGRALVTNDQWWDSDDSNKPYTWDGSAWVDATTSWLKTNPTSTYPNVVLSPSGLAAYNGSGTVVTSISSATGAINTSGSVFSNGDVSGSTVTGGVVQTTATVNRGVKINSAGLAAYNSVGGATFTIDANTGAVIANTGTFNNVTVNGTFTSAGSGRTVVIEDGYVKLNGNWLYGGPGFIYANQLLKVNGGVEVTGGISATSGSTFNGIDAATLAVTFGLTAGGFQYGSTVPEFNAAANTYITSGGVIGKAVPSAAKYKENFRPVGLTADEVLDAIDLVLFDYRESAGGFKDKLGTVADTAVGTALENFVVFDDGEVENFDYGRAAFVGLITVGRELREQIAELREENAAQAARLEILEAS
jgi:hypothetical protein